MAVINTLYSIAVLVMYMYLHIGVCIMYLHIGFFEQESVLGQWVGPGLWVGQLMLVVL